jgi:Zn-dependent metalloprotease
MRSIFTAAFVFGTFFSFAGGTVQYSKHRVEKTFYQDTRRMPDKNYQATLRSQAPWQNFLDRNGKWWVMFNEDNRKPHRAYGVPIQVSGTNAQDCAMNFIQSQLSDFRIPVSDLVIAGTPSSEKFRYVNYYQTYQGLRVLDSRLVVKMTPDFKVVMFGADVYDQITVSVNPAITASTAGSFASADLYENIMNITVKPELSILPVPKDKSTEFHLVYTVNVSTMDANEIPADYYTLVDAVTGEILYRQNMVLHFGEHDNHTMPGTVAEVQTEATIYMINPYVTPVTVNLPNMDITANSSGFLTDGNGYVNTGITGPVSGSLSLSGSWSTVRTANVTPTFTTTFNAGLNTITFDNNSNIRERSAYYHVNVVHDHMKAAMPTFSGMDFSLPTNVDVSGTCNAFYNGVSINFYAQGGGCTSFATVADVIYHEYGHGINNEFYIDNGGTFQNGAMGEGYADFWAYSISESPVVGYGTDLAVSTDYIRRYDEGRKVYPINIVGEVHADGEIIAGAWWDTYLNLGNDMSLTMDLFVEAYLGLQANTFNGNEGQAFTDVLIDVLMADDTDADLTNGTPNGQAIVDAFDLHGISLISNATLTHTQVSTSAEAVVIPINADLDLDFPYTDYLSSVKCFYKVNNGAYTSLPMVNTTGDTYSVDLPAQPIGTVIYYYLGAEDINGLLTAVIPIGASAPDPNIPHIILVGYSLKKTDDVGDFAEEFGNWTITLPSDNNTTGDWINAIPMGSFGTAGDLSTAVQPYYQHTTGGDLCFVTANAANETDGIGTADVDGGHTTLQSGTIDLTSYTNPTFTYWRWYTNSPSSGANPNADWWQVYVSNDNGSTWVAVENTKTSDQSWRRNAFRVQDYVTPTSTVKIKFIASDSLRPGTNLDGGSLVEAALDDIQLWDNVDPSSAQEFTNDGMQMSVIPNPANDQAVVMFELMEAADVQIQVTDITGKLVYEESVNGLSPGLNRKAIPASQLEAGIYHIAIIVNGKTYVRKLIITK